MTAFGEQLALFPRDPASDLARDFLDTAWLVVSLRTYLSRDAASEIRSAHAYLRERIVSVTFVEKVARGLVQIPPQRPRYELVARPDQPPTLVRVRGAA